MFDRTDVVFALFIGFVIMVRIVELIYSNHNEKWLRSQGAIEYGKQQYLVIVAMHTLFFISVIAEYILRDQQMFSLTLLIVYFEILVLKGWVISTLGRYWNTKIFHVPGVPPIRKGVYKYIKHPNYILVAAELAIIPMVFGLYVTAIGFTVVNALVLRSRIREEVKAMLT
jgi:methyltransferase